MVMECIVHCISVHVECNTKKVAERTQDNDDDDNDNGDDYDQFSISAIIKKIFNWK